MYIDLQKRNEVAGKVIPLIPLAKNIAIDVLRKYGASFDQLQDLQQATLVGLCEAANKDNGDSVTFEAYAVKWMYGSAREHMYKDRRMFGAGITNSLKIDYDADYDSIDLRNPESICYTRQVIEKIDSLPERERTIIIAIYLDGKSYVETAASVNMSEGGLHKLIVRIKNKLRGFYG